MSQTLVQNLSGQTHGLSSWHIQCVWKRQSSKSRFYVLSGVKRQGEEGITTLIQLLQLEGPASHQDSHNGVAPNKAGDSDAQQPGT